jgi:hypothetical protein
MAAELGWDRAREQSELMACNPGPPATTYADAAQS